MIPQIPTSYEQKLTELTGLNLEVNSLQLKNLSGNETQLNNSLTKLTNLTSLKLKECTNYTFQGLETLVFPSSLRSLCINKMNFDDGTLFSLLRKTNSLNQLVLNKLYALTFEDFDNLPVQTRVTVLDLCMTGITDEGLRHVSHLFPFLTTLILSTCGQLTDEGFLTPLPSTIQVLDLSCTNITAQMLPYIRTLCNLRELGLSLCRGIAPEDFQELQPSTTLRKLVLAGTRIHRSALDTILERCSELTDLDVGDCEFESEDFYEILCPLTLESLRCAGTNIPFKAVEKLLDLPCLKELDLEVCEKLPEEIRKKASKEAFATHFKISQDPLHFQMDGINIVD